MMHTSGELMANWNRGDLRTIWETVTRVLVVDERRLQKEQGEEGWRALQHLLDTEKLTDVEEICFLLCFPIFLVIRLCKLFSEDLADFFNTNT